MDVKKLCKFNFNRQETTAGHCKNENCKFLHPDPPADANDPHWCPDDDAEDGGCLDVHCPLYHPTSCFKSQIKKFVKLQRKRTSHEQSRRITTRSESPSYEMRQEHKTSRKPQLRKRSYDRSESPVAKRKKLSTRMQKGHQYKIIKEFSKEDVSSKYRHHEKLSVSKNEVVTFVSMCDPGHSCDNFCSFARVRNQFGEKGFVPVKCLDDDQSIPLSCPLAPACEDLLFSDEEAFHSHLCLHHFHQELKMHLKSSNRCPACDEKMESDDLILHYGSAPHHKVQSLLTKGIGRAVESFKEGSDLLLQETVMKINLGHQESIKEIRQTEENNVVSLKEKLRLSEVEKEQLFADKREIETERDDLDSEKVDCINEIKLMLDHNLASKVTDLKSITEVVRKLRNDYSNDSGSSKADNQFFTSGNRPSYPEAESSLKTYHTEKENTSWKNTECSAEEKNDSLNDKRIADLNCTVKVLENSVSKATSDLYDMEKERDELDEKLEASEQMRKEDSIKFNKQLESLKMELAAHDKLFSELQSKLKKKDSIIKNIIPLIENHLETSS